MSYHVLDGVILPPILVEKVVYFVFGICPKDFCRIMRCSKKIKLKIKQVSFTTSLLDLGFWKENSADISCNDT